MKRLFACLIIALASSCVSHPVIVPIPQSGPVEAEFRDVVSFKERKVPGAEYWHKARIAYMDYRDLVHQQEESKTPIGRHAYPDIPEEYIERKKLEYLAQAETHLKKLFEVNPDHAVARQVMGLIHLHREEYDEALMQFREVLRVKPIAENAWVNIAHVHWCRKDTAKAKQALAQALKINPENRPAAALREMIETQENEEAQKKAQEDVPPFRPKLDK